MWEVGDTGDSNIDELVNERSKKQKIAGINHNYLISSYFPLSFFLFLIFSLRVRL